MIIHYTCIIHKCFFYPKKYRGNDFRKEFSELGELRNLIPSSCHVMALTAIATDVTRRVIFAHLV